MAPQVTIRISNLNTQLTREAITDSTGAYRFLALEPGNYEVVAEKAGFKRSTSARVLVQLDRETVVNHKLEVGDVRESVNVSDRAQLMEISNSVISGLVEAKTIEELPLNGRDYLQLATVQAGVSTARAQARSVNNGYGNQISIDGSRPYQNGMRLDGISLTTYSGTAPSSINGVNLGVDAIQEFSVLKSVYSAEYGRAAGGIVNAVTRSGGNARHGSVFYFHRNDNLDARNFSDPGEPPEFRRHQFGGSLGGPVVRNKTFYFVNYEGLREARGNTTVNTTLSENARRGILTAKTVTVDPGVAKALALYPLPNSDVFGDTGLFVFPNFQIGREDFVTARLDHNLSDADRLFFRYSFDDGVRTQDTDFAVDRLTDGTRTQSAVVEDTHVFSAGMLNSLKLGFLRTGTLFGDTVAKMAAADDPALSFVPGGSGIGVMVVQGLTDFPGGSGSLERGLFAFNSYQVNDDVAWSAGAHLLKVGGRLERTQFNINDPVSPNGEYRFTGIAQFLTNVPDRLRAMVAGSDPVRGYRQWIGAAYLQDTWRLSPRLTLDLGLRHEWAAVPTEVNGKLANLDELSSTSVRVGEPLYNNPSLRNFAPRVGFGLDLTGSGSTVVRGGYGIFQDLILSQYLLLAGLRNPPFFLRGSTRSLKQGDFPIAGYDAFNKGATPELKVERINRDIQQPYVQHWNLNLEQRLGAETSLRLEYTGSRGLNLSSITNDANLATPTVLADGRLFFPANGTRINSVYGQIRNRTFDAQSFYHGLHAQFLRRLSNGVQAQLAYSFSKSIDDSSNYLATSESDNAIMLPINGSPRLNRGLSSHDVRHNIVFSGIWEIPSPSGRIANRVLGGWQAGWIASYSSGLPFSARLGYDAARTLTSTADRQSGQRPDLAPSFSGNAITGDPHQWVNLAAFLRPVDGFLGNLGRNTLTGPDRADVDFSLVKRFRPRFLGESGSVDFRFESFNLLNRVNLDLPAAERMEVFTKTSTREDAARITTAAPSRELQFGLRARF